MRASQRLLLKTTIGPVEDDWHVGRFSRLTGHLRSLRGDDGEPLYAVTARDREEDAAGNDVDLTAFAEDGFDQLWLLAVDVVGALTETDAAHIEAAQQAGRGVLLTRDHQDLGACLTKLGSIGQAQHFHSVNPDPDAARCRRDDTGTPSIDWPNYHSGDNGDVQTIETPEPSHPIVRRASGEPITRLPSHPHEGEVGVPPPLKDYAAVIAVGTSKVTGARFNIAVAIEGPGRGRAVADSSFHHLCDFNWDPRLGKPSFVTETPADAVIRDPGVLADTRRYVENIAAWLGRRI
ncbi:MAG TPA: hypothetical protein VHZ26_00545 [Caulobacteraceae bacterium]|jgi:hypothetical protein|nr:hypothetical protein [Caulobacteraceae bacterium]